MDTESGSTTSPPEKAEPVTIDAFRKLDLRVGTVLTAEPHPNADRLLVLKVDLGAEQRQLVAGIRAHYDPESLVGRQIVVVANLEPATLRGIESQGMILAASSGDSLVVIAPEQRITAGAKVS
jgi:methionine--tRNA ligase beta chain